VKQKSSSYLFLLLVVSFGHTRAGSVKARAEKMIANASLKHYVITKNSINTVYFSLTSGKYTTLRQFLGVYDFFPFTVWGAKDSLRKTKMAAGKDGDCAHFWKVVYIFLLQFTQKNKHNL